MNDEEYRRFRKSNDRWALMILCLLCLVIGFAKVLHAHLVYGDWTCAIADCRKVVPGG